MTRYFFTGCATLSLLLTYRTAVPQTRGEIIRETQVCTCPHISKGIYRNFMELRDNKPYIVADFHAEQTYSNKSKTRPRSHYKITFSDPTVNTGEPVADLYALSDGEYLYINTKSAGRKKGFARACCFGQFAYFHEINPNPDEYYNTGSAVGMGGAVLGGVSSAYAQSTDKGNLPRQMIFILDFVTGFVSPLNSFKMEKILENDPELLKAYLAEPRRTNMEVMHYYLDKFLAGHP